MSLLRRGARTSVASASSPTPASKQPRQITVTFLPGNNPLEVKGESHYQDALWQVVHEFGREVLAVLLPQPENEYDSNAVAVVVGGSLVGYLSRSDAASYQPKIANLIQQNGHPIAVTGRIFGGEPDKPNLGIWLYHDPEKFGLPPITAKPAPRQDDNILTGKSYGALAWEDSLPSDRLAAIRALRRLLETETHPVQRHFMFNTLEDHLYSSREVFASALAEYEAVCEQHHLEMALIGPALVQQFTGLPSLPTYRQMAILKQKAHDYRAALMWAKRGLLVYGDQCLRAEAVADLQKRVEKMKTKVALDLIGELQPVSNPPEV